MGNISKNEFRNILNSGNAIGMNPQKNDNFEGDNMF